MSKDYQRIEVITGMARRRHWLTGFCQLLRQQGLVA
jgi:hypothetical protein